MTSGWKRYGGTERRRWPWFLAHIEDFPCGQDSEQSIIHLSQKPPAAASGEGSQREDENLSRWVLQSTITGEQTGSQPKGRDETHQKAELWSCLAAQDGTKKPSEGWDWESLPVLRIKLETQKGGVLAVLFYDEAAHSEEH